MYDTDQQPRRKGNYHITTVNCETSPESEKNELWRVGTICIEYLSLGKTGI